jgi:hypothetical protein
VLEKQMSIKRKSSFSGQKMIPVQKLWRWLIISFIGGIIVTVAGAYAVNATTHFVQFPWEKPTPPMITSLLSPNPQINYGNKATVKLTTTVVGTPPYVRDISQIILNDNPKECNLVIELLASDGFNFLPLNAVPENFIVESGYEYNNKMRVYIKDFPPRITYQITLSVYTMEPEIYGGTEKVSCNIIEINY